MERLASSGGTTYTPPMFGLGPTELLVIAVIALLVLGPQRIPQAASQLGKAIRSFRRSTQELRDQVDEGGHLSQSLADLQSALRGDIGPSSQNNSLLPVREHPLEERAIAFSEEPVELPESAVSAGPQEGLKKDSIQEHA